MEWTACLQSIRSQRHATAVDGMDNMIVSSVRIYFPRPGEKLPIPSADMRTFAIKSTTAIVAAFWGSGVLGFWDGKWRVLSMPEYESSEKAIMAVVRGKKQGWA